MNRNEKKQAGLLSAIAGAVAGAFAGDEAEDKARLEAFLGAIPFEYCGFLPNGGTACSAGFCALLGLKDVRSIHDIQSVLPPADAAALEGLFTHLQKNCEGFTLTARIPGKSKTLRLTGAAGAGGGNRADGALRVDVLWAEDVTAGQNDLARAAREQERVQDSRDRLQTALDTVPAPLWMRDSRTDLTWCNQAYAATLDTTHATVIAEQKELPVKAAARKAPAAKSPGRGLAQAVLDSGKAETVTAHVIAGGSRRLMAIQEIPLPAFHGTLGIARDITREEELETEQKRNAAANKELLEQLGSAIGIFDSGQRLEFYNSAFTQLWHVEDQYLNTKPKLGDLMEKLRERRRLPEQVDFRRFKESWLGMFTSLINPHEEMLYLPDNTAVRMLAVPHPMGGLMITFEDVTSRLELESSYNTLIAVQKETLDNLAEGVAVYGGDGRLKLWNPSFVRLWNLAPEDMEGNPHAAKLADAMTARFADPKAREDVRKALTNQSLTRRLSEGRMKNADGLLVAYSTVPLPDGGVLVTHVDITDKTRVETALREKNAALEAAEQLKLDFLANVSYQLRTPLNAIMGFAEILGNEYFGTLTSRQKEYADGIREAGQRLVHLIDDILDLSTIEAGYMELESNNVAIRDTLQGLYTLTLEWARKEGIEAALDCPADIGAVTVDERRLKQVLLNLIRNAIAFTPPGGKIVIAARRDNDNVAISVTDTGPGIPAADQERVFEPFTRAQSEQAPGAAGRGGAGLGLTLVKNIVEMHGGHVRLESAEGKGTAITVTLPSGARTIKGQEQERT